MNPPPPRTDTPRRPYKTRPSACEPPTDYRVGNTHSMLGRKHSSTRQRPDVVGSRNSRGGTRWYSNRSLKQFEIDRFAHGSIAGVAWMQVVAAVIGCGHGGRTGRVGNDTIEVDDGIEAAAAPDPGIDGLALELLFGGKISLVGSSRERVFERRQRAADDLDRAKAGTLDQLLVTGNDLIGGAN